MQILTRLIILALLATTLVACAHFPLGMSEAEWNRLSTEQQLDARKEQAALDQERALAREKARQEREAREAEQERLQYERDVARGMIAQFDEVCMGGSRCPDRDKKMHIYSLREFAYVDKVELTAHDNVGNKHGATLALYADNQLIVENLDIKRNGSTQTIFVGAVARNILLKVRNDDEVKVQQLKVFGQSLASGTTQIIVRQPLNSPAQ